LPSRQYRERLEVLLFTEGLSASRDEGKWLALPLHYLFDAIPVGDSG
jgi:hypothetical protein